MASINVPTNVNQAFIKHYIKTAQQTKDALMKDPLSKFSSDQLKNFARKWLNITVNKNNSVIDIVQKIRLKVFAKYAKSNHHMWAIIFPKSVTLDKRFKLPLGTSLALYKQFQKKNGSKTYMTYGKGGYTITSQNAINLQKVLNKNQYAFNKYI